MKIVCTAEEYATKTETGACSLPIGSGFGQKTDDDIEQKGDYAHVIYLER